MDEGVKRKLVGAGALVIVALIVLPQITPKSQSALQLSNSVPLETNIPVMAMPLPKSLSIAVSPVVQDQPGGQIVGMGSMKVDDQTLMLDGFEVPVNTVTGQAVLWHIQVGSFSKIANAIQLRDSLRGKGYKAFEQLTGDGVHTRVFVGPSTQRASLQKQMQEINKQFKLKSKLIPFQNN